MFPTARGPGTVGVGASRGVGVGERKVTWAPTRRHVVFFKQEDTLVSNLPDARFQVSVK
jgi:hypothetical protein